MKLHFTVEPLKFKTIEELPNAWTTDKFKMLLDIMEYGDTSDLSDQEVKEMCMLSLADNEPEEAAKIVLGYIFGERLNEGQIDNISNEMLEEKMWEEYADLSMHEEFFNATQLLYQSFNGKFPHPEAVGFRVDIQPKEKLGMRIFEKDVEIALIRLLVQGMPENTLIQRLFHDSLESGAFEEAKDIIWQFTKETKGEERITFDLISSSYWFRDLRYAQRFEADLVDEEPATS